MNTKNNHYWINRWESNDVDNFCQESPNNFLVKHFDRFKVGKNSVCFIPMCGNSIDIAFFLSKRVSVVGIELSEKAALSFFTQNKLEFKVVEKSGYKCYQGEKVAIYVTDIFNLQKMTNLIPKIDIWYDRGAYIALPQDLRAKYAKMMLLVCSTATQILMLTIHHDKKVDTPPYSVTKDEIQSAFYPKLKFELIDREQREVIPDYRKVEGVTYQVYEAYICRS